MSDIYKYRIGKKWYTFDKSILEPEDLRVFDLANWQDKLKLITIYNDLKHVEDDNIMILKTKKENPNKDKRANEYRKKRDKLNELLVKANKENKVNEIKSIKKQINDLNIEYADIVNINNAETVNISTANKVVLKDVKDIVKETSEKLNALSSTTLSQADFNTIKSSIEDLLKANTENDFKNSLNEVKQQIKLLGDTSLTPTIERTVNEMLTKLDTIVNNSNKIDSTIDKLNNLTDMVNNIDKNNTSLTSSITNGIDKILTAVISTNEGIDNGLTELKHRLDLMGDISMIKNISLGINELLKITGATNATIKTNNKTIKSDIEELKRRLILMGGDSAMLNTISLGVNELLKITDSNNETVKSKIKELKKLVEETGDSEILNNINNQIESITKAIDDVNNNEITSIEAVKEIDKKFNELNESLVNVEYPTNFEDLVYILNNVLDLKDHTKLKQIYTVSDFIDKFDLTGDEIEFLTKNKDTVKKVVDSIKDITKVGGYMKYIKNYVAIYEMVNEHINEKQYMKLGFDVGMKSTITKAKYVVERNDEGIKILFQCLSFYNGEKTKLVFKEVSSASSRTHWQFIADYDVRFTGTKNLNTEGVLNIVKETINDLETGEGFLGLKTNKEASKDMNLLKQEIQELRQELNQLKEQLNDIKQQPAQQPAQQPEQFEEVKPVIKAPSRTFNFLTDISQKPMLKHVQPTKKAPELTELDKILNKRRIDIEYDTDSDDSIEWGDGLQQETKGGILKELQNDLKRYGLVLSLSPDKNAYFVNVFNRRNPRGSGSSSLAAAGVQEAEELVKNTNQDTEYKDLKKLYESLY